MKGEAYDVYTSLKKEIKHITFEYVKLLASRLDISVRDLCRIVGIRGGKHIKLLESGESPLSRSQKIAIYYFDAFFEQKARFGFTSRVRSISYWKGYTEAGGTAPDDIIKLGLVCNEDHPMSLVDYRRGVLDHKNEENANKIGD